MGEEGMTASTTVDPRELRNALGSFATGVAIVTTNEGDHDVGMTINSFNSVSLDPPMVLWSLAKSSASLPVFTSSGYFAIHILSAEQQDLSQKFATRGIDKFADVALERGEGNVPIIQGCSAVFHCKTSYKYEGGDHEIFVGEVLKFEHFEKSPLVFHAGKYALAVAKQKAPEAKEEVGFNANSLTYLMGLVYFKLANKAAKKMADHGIDSCQMAVLNALSMGESHTIAEINKIVSVSGLAVTSDVLHSMAEKNLVSLSGEGQALRASLADDGSNMLMKMIAYVQAIEDEAMPDDAYTELSLAKSLLKKAALNLLKK
jgi:3-hydroxy-9,10-secoandrosta-1,3,5(10)-triene-9,17-dione monooxygenase reductase component